MELKGELRDLLGLERKQNRKNQVSSLHANRFNHPDFEYVVNIHEQGIVQLNLGGDGTPAHIGDETQSTHGPDEFHSWYHDDQKFNIRKDFTIPLTEIRDGIFQYENNEFFPLDNMVGTFGKQKPTDEHNYHFTYAIRAHQFTYKGNEKFSFRGDDDLWLFINGKLVIDLGGSHKVLEAEIDLTLDPGENTFNRRLSNKNLLGPDHPLAKASNERLILKKGDTVSFDLFFAERHRFNSRFKVTTSMLILPPPPVVTIKATDPEAQEFPRNDGEFTVCLDRPADEECVIQYKVTGSATQGTDYEELGKIVFQPGQQEVKLPVIPKTDNEKEGNETVIVTLQESKNKKYTVGTPSSATVTIDDAICPIVCIEASDPQAVEPGPNITGDNGAFTITLDRPSWQDLTINLKPAGGTATDGKDYQSLPTQITIPAGDVEYVIPVVPIQDDVKEGAETVILTLDTGKGYELCQNPEDNQATVTIIDQIPIPCAAVTAPKPHAKEPGNGQPGVNGLFTIYLERPAYKDITVHYSISGSATPNADYNALSGSVLIRQGHSSVNLPVIPRADSQREGTETVVLTLKASPDGSYELKPSYGKTQATVNILDMPLPPFASIVASQPVAREPGHDKPRVDGEFTIRLTYPLPKPTRVRYRVGGTADQGRDYTHLIDAVVPAYQTIVKLPVVPLKDEEVERSETVEVSLLDGQAYDLDPNPRRQVATVQILDTPPIEVSIKTLGRGLACEPRESGDEASRQDQAQFAIELSEKAPKRMRVAYGISGSATPGRNRDYILKDDRGRVLGDKSSNNKIVFKKGQKRFIIHVVPIGDRDYREREETVTATLEDGNGYILTRRRRATIRIKPFNTRPGLVGGGPSN
ncbi:MAG: fibro-slime domain-containing protein [Cyanobacteria bacterium P01_A01_bin.37]